MNEKEREDLVECIDTVEDALQRLHDRTGVLQGIVIGMRDLVTHPDSEKHLRCPRCDTTDYDPIKRECPNCTPPAKKGKEENNV